MDIFEFFSTGGGAASIFGLILAIWLLFIDRSSTKAISDGQQRLEKQLTESSQDTRRIIEEGNRRAEESRKETRSIIAEGNRRMERAEDLTREMIAATDRTTKEILHEISKSVA